MQLRSIDTAEGRIVIAQVHEHLRRQILDGTLPPGSVLSQVQLAQQLGVSRTPLREALRLLQEERLVLAEHNHRVRVADINLEELESLYASRIMLETLALALTVPRLSQSELDTLAQALDAMHVASTRRDNDAWEQGNRRFHALLAIHAEERIRQTIKRSIDASERYRRIKLQTVPHAREVAEAEHAAILAACRERDLDAAVEMLARHLARTALTVIAQAAPEYEPTAVRTALRLVTGKVHSSGQPK
ncbi:MAG TPA: GntR family transcriptional regulator [Ktedonobacteraceae bacterium]|nr:GntR family transcriptional regulator [Ktedonobacteraceae bacterium]